MNMATQLPPVTPMQAINHVEIPAVLQKGVKASRQYKQIPGSWSFSEIPVDYDTYTPYQQLKCKNGSRITGAIWEKKLLVLIQKQYSINRASKYHDWQTILLAPYSDMWKELFLNVAPNLVEWEDILSRGIELKTFYFVITMLKIYNFMLDPKIWKGSSHSVVLMLYYINIKNVMFLYVEDEQQFYKYNGKC